MNSKLSSKCTQCEGEIALLACPFCGQAVETRWNAMTGEHYIHHVDCNSRCPQRPFYGNEAQWNERTSENALRTALAFYANRSNWLYVPEDARQSEKEIAGLREELAATQAAGSAKNERIGTLLRTIETMRNEVIAWIEASNSGMKVMREQRGEIERLQKLVNDETAG